MVTEKFFLLLRRNCIKRKVYSMLEEARSDIFDYIEMFYSSKCRHDSSNKISLPDYKKDYFNISEMSSLSVKMNLTLFYKQYNKRYP
ncbi:IS3 family transposase [Photorhabdus sp. S9-53]|uniref:IS3 family transposase n=1 Tax=unclassified Photorhabdus TaxID=2620880 RepID=UPI00351AA753